MIEPLRPDQVVNNTIIALSTCGAKGHTGPTIHDCREAYSSDQHVSELLVDVRGGIQRVRIPATGLYMLTAEGGNGGDGYVYNEASYGHHGGAGAAAWTVAQLEEGQIMNVVVGQYGGNRDSYLDQAMGGAGGGGSFIWKEGADEPLLAAGGGGGGTYGLSDPNYYGQPGQSTPDGSRGVLSGGAGGSNGNGGQSAQNSINKGGAGAGWRSDGDCSGHYDSLCAQGRLNGFTGGSRSQDGGYPLGGFGGGGGGNYEGGGGGGYSGGVSV